MSEIDLEQCETSTNFLESLYHFTLGKRWACPEMLWALMEVVEEVSQKRFGKHLFEAYSSEKQLNWAT